MTNIANPPAEMPTRYDASLVETKWYERWEAAGLFQPDPNPAKPRYTITIPPPNITGSLHMGHALCYPLQDALGRFYRLRGYSVLILPGQDHAGIATQSVVDKQLRKEGSSAAQIGREAFIERVWAWRKESGDTILRQFRQLGCGFDWSRSRFTLDEAYAEAVLKVFIDWFDRGLIFRGKRVVNWDPVLRTSVSDIETERKTVKGKLYYVRYPYADGNGSITIATTRPETMLADVAVAVHPSDERYKGQIGRKLRLPLMNREIPLIADIYPDPAFGSGAVKITPAHDANDYAVGQRHDLDMPVLLDDRARMTEAGGPYAGLDRLAARKKIVEDLEAQGFLEKVDDHELNIIVSERSGEVIEPLLSEQWFCDQPSLAGPVIAAVEAGEIRFTPERYNRIFLEWLRGIREWCISRQLWWGHRIPVYYTESGRAVAALNLEAAVEKAGEPIVRQDEDVLDTWFSSGLWPFATLGWPAQTADLAERYPTSTLVTDRNIINLWVARMAMMGLDLAGAKPFTDVMIYATVLTEDGRRMSKSLGTGVDPVGVIESIGADALRFTLQSQTGQNQDIRYSERKTEEARNFANKIWNATRFVLQSSTGGFPDRPTDLKTEDRWLLSRLKTVEAEAREGYERFDFQSVCQGLYRFFWNELCDWYIEISKPRLAAGEPTPAWVLLVSIRAFLTMLHPVMPHLTEELYSHLPEDPTLPKAEFLMAEAWPDLSAIHADPEAEAELEAAFAIVQALRRLRADLGLNPLKTIPEAFAAGDLGRQAEVIRSQAWLEALTNAEPPSGTRCVQATVGAVRLFLPIGGLVDLEAKVAQLQASLQKVVDEAAKMRLRLDNPQFVERAKPEVVAKEQELFADLLQREKDLRAQIALFSGA
jgi:valyl-tRNA synthetase